MSARPLRIAVDGPGSSGKGTVARAVARQLGYTYIDTGALYRAIAWSALRKAIDWDDGPALAAVARGMDLRFTWDGEMLGVVVDGHEVTRDLRRDAMSTGASRVSRHPEVRDALLDQQRRMAAAGGVVMDGRDIGTVVLPDAELKVYLDADLDERARRRHEELVRRGEGARLTEVRDALAQRDRQDRERAVAPLKVAPDAILVDTTDLTIRQATDAVLRLARDRLAALDAAVGDE